MNPTKHMEAALRMLRTAWREYEDDYTKYVKPEDITWKKGDRVRTAQDDPFPQMGDSKNIKYRAGMDGTIVDDSLPHSVLVELDDAPGKPIWLGTGSGCYRIDNESGKTLAVDMAPDNYEVRREQEEAEQHDRHMDNLKWHEQEDH